MRGCFFFFFFLVYVCTRSLWESPRASYVLCNSPAAWCRPAYNQTANVRVFCPPTALQFIGTWVHRTPADKHWHYFEGNPGEAPERAGWSVYGPFRALRCHLEQKLEQETGFKHITPSATTKATDGYCIVPLFPRSSHTSDCSVWHLVL